VGSDKGDNRLVVLIADDDGDTRQMLRIALQRENYRVLEAEDGQQVLSLLEQEVPDALILDLGLPVLNGPEVCAEIRQRGLSLPILVLTAYENVNLKVLVLDAGADDYVTKPFVLEEFLARVRALTRRSAARV